MKTCDLSNHPIAGSIDLALRSNSDPTLSSRDQYNNDRGFPTESNVIIPPSAIVEEGSAMSEVTPFVIHRKLLRRRHVLKEKRETAVAAAKAPMLATETFVVGKRGRHDQEKQTEGCASSPKESAETLGDASSNHASSSQTTMVHRATTVSLHTNDETEKASTFSSVQTRYAKRKSQVYDQGNVHS